MIKRFKKYLCCFALIGVVAGTGRLVLAYNSDLDVTVSNLSGYVSVDPYSLNVTKDDDVQKFYISLSSLSSQATYMDFFSQRKIQSNYMSVSGKVRYSRSSMPNSKSFQYNEATFVPRGSTCRVKAIAPEYTANVHAVGMYCP